MVVSIPATVAMAMMMIVATSPKRLYIVQELHLGLQRTGVFAESTKKSSGQVELALLKEFCQTEYKPLTVVSIGS